MNYLRGKFGRPRVMLWWNFGPDVDHDALAMALDGDLLSHVVFATYYPNYSDNPRFDRLQELVAGCKNANVEPVLSKWLWPVDRADLKPRGELLTEKHVIGRCRAARDEAARLDISSVCLDAEAYPGSEFAGEWPASENRKGSKANLLLTEFERLRSACELSKLKDSQNLWPEYSLPATSNWSDRHVYNATRNLGRASITELTYQGNISKYPNVDEYDIFGAWLSVTRGFNTVENALREAWVYNASNGGDCFLYVTRSDQPYWAGEIGRQGNINGRMFMDQSPIREKK